MSLRSSLRHSGDIARAEWTRHHREFGSPVSGRPVTLVVLVAVALALGWLGHELGRDLDAGQQLPYDLLSLLVSVAFVWLAWRSSQLTHRRFERLNPDFLLTTVPARTAALGLLGFVFAGLATTLVLPMLGVAVGLAVGLRSPLVALTVVVAVAGLVALAVAFGTAGRLTVRLLALRLVRARFYRDLLVVFGWIPLLVGVMILQELSISITPLFAVFGALPLAWFVDLALLGGVRFGFGSVAHALGALALLVPTVPLLAFGTTVFARRIWESEPTGSVSSIGSGGSHSLIEPGVLERLVGERVSRPVRTVARERWLMERRISRGLLMTGYVVFVGGLISVPVLFFIDPYVLLLLVATLLGLAGGIAFGSAPIGTEYRVLPMLFTSVTGRQFVGGLLLAASVVGVPLVAIIVVPLGLVGSIGVGQTVATALVGMAACACTASVAVAVGLGIDRYDLVPMPFFFTDIPIYGEQGLKAFLRLGAVFAVVLFATIPAFVGNAPPVYQRLTGLGVPVAAVRIGSLLLTVLILVAVTRTAYRIAVSRFRDFQIG